jgi:erythromycin esterase-like protein
MAVPEKAQSRSVALDPVESTGSLARADELGLMRIGLGAISGGRFNECTSNWQTADMAMPPVPFGRLEAVITAAAARTVRVESLMTTLCNLLAGSNCETTPQAMWTRQPDAMVNGEPGYALATEFSAISARIQ